MFNFNKRHSDPHKLFTPNNGANDFGGGKEKVARKIPLTVEVEKRIPNSEEKIKAVQEIFPDDKFTEIISNCLVQNRSAESKEKLIKLIKINVNTDITLYFLDLFHKKGVKVGSMEELKELIKEGYRRQEIQHKFKYDFKEPLDNLNEEEEKKAKEAIRSLALGDQQHVQTEEKKIEFRDISDHVDGTETSSDANDLVDNQISPKGNEIEEQKSHEEVEKSELEIKFEEAEEKIQEYSGTEKEFKKQYGGREIFANDFKKIFRQGLKDIKEHHIDAVDKVPEEQEEVWRKAVSFADKINDPNNAKQYFIVEGKTFVVDQSSDGSQETEKWETIEGVDEKILDALLNNFGEYFKDYEKVIEQAQGYQLLSQDKQKQVKLLEAEMYIKELLEEAKSRYKLDDKKILRIEEFILNIKFQ